MRFEMRIKFLFSVFFYFCRMEDVIKGRGFRIDETTALVLRSSLSSSISKVVVACGLVNERSTEESSKRLATLIGGGRGARVAMRR